MYENEDVYQYDITEFAGENISNLFIKYLLNKNNVVTLLNNIILIVIGNKLYLVDEIIDNKGCEYCDDEIETFCYNVKYHKVYI